jgi:FMS-like tyrosine kinase 1
LNFFNFVSFQFKAEAIGIGKIDVETVAVKMANSPMDREHLSALMAEIKIMLYIGKHLNIVNILGACTGNLKTKRNLNRFFVSVVFI